MAIMGLKVNIFQIGCRLAIMALLMFMTNLPALAGQQREKVAIYLRWTHQFQFAGYYAALDQGFYADEGLDVELIEFDRAQGHYEPVLSGRAQYGIDDASILPEILKSNQPFVVVAQIFQHSPLVLMALEQSGIYSPLDMVNKKVMYNLGDSPLDAMFSEYGQGKINFERVPHSYNYEDLADGKVDVISAYLTDQPYAFEKRGLRVNIIDPRSYGIDFYGDNLFTTWAEANNHPERVEKVRRATLKGWEYALRHQDELIDLILTTYNSQLERAQLEYEANTIKRMISPDIIPLGTVDRKRYQRIAEVYAAQGFIDEAELPENFIFSQRKEILTAEERAWLQTHPEIRLGFAADYEPYLMVDESGHQRGILPDFIALINRRMGANIKIKLANNNDQAAMLERGELEGLLAVVPQRIQKLNLLSSQPYSSVTAAAFIHKDSDFSIQDISDLVGKIIVFARDNEFIINLLQPVREQLEVVEVATPLDAMAMVYQGTADVMIGSTTNKHLIRTYHLSGVFPGHVFTDQTLPISAGFRTDLPKLAEMFDKVIATIGREEKNQLYLKWVGAISKPTGLIFTDEERQWLKDNPLIPVAIDANFAPVEFRDKDNKPQGISIEYLRIIEKKLGVRFHFPDYENWSETMQALEKGELKMAAAVQDSNKRRRFLDFTSTFLSLPLTIFAPERSDYFAEITHLEGKRVGVVAGYPILEFLSRDYPRINLTTVESINDGLDLLAEGRIDAFIDTLAITSYYMSLRGMSHLKVAGNTPYSYELSMGVRKEEPLLRSVLEKALVSIPEKERSALVQQWFNIKYDYTPDYSLFWKAGIPAALVISLVLLWNRKLQSEINLRRIVEERFQTLIEGIKNEYTFYVHDIDGKISYVSPSALELTGYDSDELKGKYWQDLITNEASLAQATEHVQKLLNGEQSRPYEIDFYHKDGSCRTWLVFSLLKTDCYGKPQHLEGLVKDVTREKAYALELAQAKEAAESASRAKSTFLANMSHELRTPLTAILAFSNFLQRQKDISADSLSKLEIVNRNGKHLVKVVNEILELSRIEAGFLELNNEPFNLDSMLEDLCSLFRLQAEDKRLWLKFVSIPGPVGKPLIGDQLKLRQILVNLIGNACKFTQLSRVSVIEQGLGHGY
jgi:two-component system sensor histidine kinase EvgS